ncbi:uncharacterized protein MONBRDRAFT_16440 [Monosiga brevicollis MX1]|uniref:Methyltransferase type 11 domain-containing protein n=1 Tax=Monosiga brevicollis TaxID=81824 RepID=A9UX28_MONBE|nr:uncharacterized protein MONBRDRAFT_16440 [Monosiga brevicollis MX1]EDQ90142.1 predicted protein [Monosiga brevicollis MX1]|eukprot:XP_001744909.1 hypothetical protein [Monosiga brevicollis MX1]
MQHSKPQVRAVPVPDEPAEAALQTPDLERTNVQAVYEDIAGHWDHTRHSPWPRVADFLGKLAPGSLVADVGCGNGKYMLVAPPQCVMLGSDVCRGLVELCGEKGLEVATGDNMTLPYRDGVFDAAISIAVLHHFSSAARRRRAIWELARIVRPGGLVLVQAWALEQVRSRMIMLPVSSGFIAMVLTWSLSRYCHVYCEGELGELVESTAQFEVQECFYDASNWCVIAQRCT